MAVIAPLLMITAASGGTASTNLNLNVIVPQEFTYRVVAEPITLTLTGADLSAGVKTYPGATSITIDTNTTNGYVLSVQAMNYGAYASITFHVQGHSMSYQLLPGDFIEVHIPNPGTNPTTEILDFNINIAPGTSAGVYNWPVVVAAHPL
jgi:hypothetical protein